MEVIIFHGNYTSNPTSPLPSPPSPLHKKMNGPLEKRAISYLFVSARSKVIDPFSQMKRENNTILDDADSANRITLSHLQALHDALRETFLKVTNI